MSDQGRMRAIFRSGASSLARAAGWRDIRQTAGDIHALGKALRDRETADDMPMQATLHPADLATLTGISASEVERRMWNRRRETKWAARVFAGGFVFSGLEAINALFSTRIDLSRSVWLGGMTVMLSLGYTYNALLNWQLRARRPVSVGDLLQQPNEWWPR